MSLEAENGKAWTLPQYTCLGQMMGAGSEGSLLQPTSSFR